MTGTELNRLRWRCRRGMLELDLVLARFLSENYDGLTPAGRRAFEHLVALPDQELWALIRGDEFVEGDLAFVLQQLRVSKDAQRENKDERTQGDS